MALAQRAGLATEHVTPDGQVNAYLKVCTVAGMPTGAGNYR